MFYIQNYIKFSFQVINSSLAWNYKLSVSFALSLASGTALSFPFISNENWPATVHQICAMPISDMNLRWKIEKLGTDPTFPLHSLPTPAAATDQTSSQGCLQHPTHLHFLPFLSTSSGTQKHLPPTDRPIVVSVWHSLPLQLLPT